MRTGTEMPIAALKFIEKTAFYAFKFVFFFLQLSFWIFLNKVILHQFLFLSMNLRAAIGISIG